MNKNHKPNIGFNRLLHLCTLFYFFFFQGACLLRMLEGILGKVTFNIGIMSYIKKFQYCNTHMDDLWNELKSATLNTVDVKRVKLYEITLKNI